MKNNMINWNSSICYLDEAGKVIHKNHIISGKYIIIKKLEKFRKTDEYTMTRVITYTVKRNPQLEIIFGRSKNVQPLLQQHNVSSSASKDNEHLWKQFCRLGEMMGDGLHYEPDGKWIAKEYRQLKRGLKEIRKKQGKNVFISKIDKK